VIAVIVAVFAFGIDDALTLAGFRARQAQLQDLVAAQFGVAVAVFFAAWFTITALNIPGAAVMTLVAGALFGLTVGTLIVSFASTIGATLAFVLARFLFRDAVERRFAHTAERIASGIREDGAYYLFTLRLMPIFPFFVINLAMARTRLRTRTFAWVGRAGMLAGTLVYVNAGTQIGRVDNIADIASPQLPGSFALLGIFPMLTKKISAAVTAGRRVTLIEMATRITCTPAEAATTAATVTVDCDRVLVAAGRRVAEGPGSGTTHRAFGAPASTDAPLNKAGLDRQHPAPECCEYNGCDTRMLLQSVAN